MPPKRKSARSSRSSKRGAKVESPEPDLDDSMEVTEESEESKELLDEANDAPSKETEDKEEESAPVPEPKSPIPDAEAIASDVAEKKSEDNVTTEPMDTEPVDDVEEEPKKDEPKPEYIKSPEKHVSPTKRIIEEKSVEEEKTEDEPPTKKLKSDGEDEEMTANEPVADKVEKKDEKKQEEEKKEEKPVETEEEKKERREKEKKEREEKTKAKELEKFWKAVKDDPSDFQGWTYLLQFADNLSDPNSGRDAYNAFLLRYPYCYGYWKKYADFEKKKTNEAEKCMAVFERGTQAIPMSTDLWVHFLNYVKTADEYKENKEFIRAQYERAVEACGREWRSDKLWDHYVKFETDNKNLENVYKLYQRILKNPTQGLSHQFDMFRDFIKDNNPKDIMEVNDFLALRKEILAGLKGEEDKEKEDKKEEKSNGDAKEGEKEEAAPGEDTEGTKSDEETLAIREKIIFSQKKLFKATEEKVNARWKYEEGIKRPYFHVKPLERNQLKNWHDYIDFTKKSASKEGGDLTEVEILYERCLIACALYEEFWMKYVSWFEKREGDFTEKIRDILKRACTHHLPTKVDVHLRWAAFEESQGDFDKGSDILEALEKKFPELISLMLSRINLERRRGNFDKVVELYESCIKSAKSQTIASDLSTKMSRFVRLQRGDSMKATDIINTALEQDPTNPKLYMQLLDIYLHSTPIDNQKVTNLFDKALGQEKMPSKHKILFSQRKVEFLEDFGQDVKVLQAAQAAHTALSKHNKAPSSKEADSSNTTPTGSGISTIEGRTGKNKSSNGSSYPPVTNSASYGASQNAAYNNYGSRYSQYPANYNYNQYYGQGQGQSAGAQQGYGGGQGGYGGSGSY